MAGEPNRTEDWQTLPWKAFQRNVFRLQKRIYTCTCSADASVKLRFVATSSVSATYNGCCFALFQCVAWLYGRYRKTTGARTPPE